MFQLGKLTFEVEHATVYGFYNEAALNKRTGSLKEEEEFCWAINISMEEGDFIYELTEEDLEDLKRMKSLSMNPYLRVCIIIMGSSYRFLPGKIWKDRF